MKRGHLFFLGMFLLSSCGALRLSPQGCKSSGVWGPGETAERKISAEYYVLTMDREIRLRDFLKEKGIDCQDVKKIRVEMSSVFFVKRILNVFVY
jgi:hypothetical protein